MKSPKSKLLHLSILSLFLGCPLSGAELRDAWAAYGNVEEIKSANPGFTDWLPVKFEGREFIFCQKIQPSFGVSLIDFHGWQYNPAGKKWEPLIHLVTKGVGKAILSFNPKPGSSP